MAPKALGSTAVAEAARVVLARAKELLGADAAFVAKCTPDEAGLEVVLLDPGRLDLDTSADLPAPLRRLCARARSAGRAVFSNTLSRRSPEPSSARSYRAARSALVAPIVIAGEVAGIVGLIDKHGGFSREDRRLGGLLAEMAAVAMRDASSLNGLEKNRDALARQVRQGAGHLRLAEEAFRKLVENLPDLIARFDKDLRNLYVSPALQRLIGPGLDCAGKTIRELGLPAELVDPWDAALRRVLATGLPDRLEIAFPGRQGTQYLDFRLVAEREPEGDIVSVLSVARDVTDRRLAYEAEQRARSVAEALREASVALTRSLDRESVLATLLECMAGLVSFDRATVMLLEEPSLLSVRAVFDGGRVVQVAPSSHGKLDPAEHPIVCDILKTRAPLLVPDVSARPDWSLPTDDLSEASWLGVPLFARGDVAGLFSLSKREPGFFNEGHVKLAEAMSSQASVAVENAILWEQMQASTQRMQLLSRRLVEVQENERRRIALELHDEAGQALTSLRFGLRLLEREIHEGNTFSIRVGDLVQRTDDVIDGLHRLAADLRPVSLDQLGLEAALRQYSQLTACGIGIDVQFKSGGFSSERLAADLETALFRVAQEALTNVVRHARATRVDVLLRRDREKVLVMIEDDGVGFEQGRVWQVDRLGLIGMKERAEAVGGTLTIESASGKGTTVVVEVPVADPHPDR